MIYMGDVAEKNKNKIYNCGGSKTWALAVGLSITFYQQYIRGEEIIRKPRN